MVMWIFCGVAAAGIHNSNLRTEFARIHQNQSDATSNLIISGVIGLMGPIALVIVPIIHGLFNGKPITGWTLEWRAFPCSETNDISREVWCGIPRKAEPGR